jgi:hypothetical protein
MEVNLFFSNMQFTIFMQKILKIYKPFPAWILIFLGFGAIGPGPGLIIGGKFEFIVIYHKTINLNIS